MQVLLIAGLAALWLLALAAVVWCFRRTRRGCAAPSKDGADLVFLGLGAFIAGALVHFLAPLWVSWLGVEDFARHSVLAGLLLVSVLLVAVARRAIPGVDALGTSPSLLPSGSRFGFAAYLAFLPVIMGIHEVHRSHLLPEELRNAVQETLVFLVETESTLARVLLVLLLVTAVPLFEELVYRGTLQSGLSSLLEPQVGARAGSAIAVLVASSVFAFVHDPFTRIPVFVLGVMLGGLYAATRNLWVPVIFHSAHNMFTIALWMADRG